MSTMSRETGRDAASAVAAGRGVAGYEVIAAAAVGDGWLSEIHCSQDGRTFYRLTIHPRNLIE
jgi:hypothetical protein